jgi:hypothetical protein
MSTWVWIVIAVAAALVLLLVLWSATRRRRTTQLRGRFGPEYDRTIEAADGRRHAERELREREEHRSRLDIRPLKPEARDRYRDEWKTIQSRFVDDPNTAVGQADLLVQDVMRERGYPTDDFEQRVGDISVDHPHVAEHYREAHKVAVARERGQANTEDLRQSLVHYRSLFDELLVVEQREPADASART